MKRYSNALSTLLLAAAVVISVAFATAQNTAVSAAQDPAGKALQGKVVAVDAAKNEIALKDDQGNDLTLQVSSSTKITRAGKEIKLAEIKAGDRVFYELEAGADNPTAKSITVAPSKAT